MFVDPAESPLRQFQGLGIVCRLRCCCRGVQPKAHSIKLFAIAVERRDLTPVIESPEETAILFVPEDATQKFETVLHEGYVLVFQIRPIHRDLSGDPCHASLEHGKFSFTFSGLPVPPKI